MDILVPMCGLADSICAVVCDCRDAMRRKGVKPRDHARDNVRALREVQRAHREARETARDGSKEFKLKKFQNVKSRVAVSREGDVTSRTGAGGVRFSGHLAPGPRASCAMYLSFSHSVASVYVRLSLSLSLSQRVVVVAYRKQSDS